MPTGKINIPKATNAIICPQFTSATTKVALSTSTAKNTSPLSEGLYRLISDANCFVKQGGSTIEAATDGTSAYLPANYEHTFWVASSSDGYMAGIVSTGTGNLYITPQ